MAELETGLADDLREQQRALGRVLRAVARGEGLQPVLDELIAEASRLCGGEYGELHLVDGDMLRAFSYYVEGDLDSPIVRSAAEQWEIGRSQPHARDRSTLAGRVALLEDVVLMPDMLADPDYTYSLPAGTRAGLGVPIMLDGDLIGTLGMVRDVQSPFTDDDVELVRTFADQAAVAVKNARLLEALQRQLDQQRAVSEVLRAIARSEGLQTVLDEIVETVSILGGGDNVRLWLVRDGMLHAVANGGWSDGWEYDKAHPHPIDQGSASGRAALTKDAVHIPDITADQEYVYEGPVSFRANLSVPILLDGEPIGVFGIVRREAQPFSDDVIDLVKTFADQAAVAIANARLLDAVEKQLAEARAVSDVLRAVARRGGLQPVLDEIVEVATRLSEGDHARIYLLEGELLHAVANYGESRGFDYDKDHPHALDRTTMAGRAALTREPVNIADVQTDPDYAYEGTLGVFRAGAAVPILQDDELVGSLVVVRAATGAFKDEHIQLIRTFADQAAIAIAGARLMEAIERQLDQQRAVADILRAVAQSEGLEAVFNVVADSATRLCRGDYGALYLREGDALVVAAQRYGRPDTLQFEQEHPHPIDRTTASGRAAVTGEVVHIPDTHQDAEYSWGAAGLMEYRSLLAAPILLDGELIGAMNVVKVEPEPFAREDVELIRTFADQAAIAIANARLVAAVEQQLEQQKAISDVLGAVARAEGIESVLHAVVEIACRLCDAQFGEVHLIEGDLLRLAVGHGGPPELYEYTREHPDPAVGSRDTVNGRILLSGDVEHVPDILEDAEYSFPAADEAGVRALLGAPLLVEGELVGVFNIVRTEPIPFTAEQIELLRTFADQAAIAVAKARLVDAVERRLEQQRAISDVFGVVARSEGLDAVFTAAIEAATRLCDGGYGGLYILEDGVFHARAYCGDPEQFEYEKEHPHPPDRKTMVGRVGLTQDVVHIPNLAEDPEYDWPLLLGHHSGLGVPIIVEGELIGVISVTREPEPFTQDQVALVRTFADQAAIAIANARLLGAVERQSEELSRFVSPQVAELVSSDEGQKMLAGHRAYVTSLFCDLRGFTSFTELAEPEELFEILREYHLALGELIPRYQGTLEHFAGDGLMVFFNDPVPVEEHELKAVELALEAQERFEELAASWRKRGHELGLGIGIAAGYATLGRIGFEGRYDYGVLGTVTNLASRLSDRAEPGEVLISQRVYAAVEEQVEAESAGEVELKGFGRPVVAYKVSGVRQA